MVICYGNHSKRNVKLMASKYVIKPKHLQVYDVPFLFSLSDECRHFIWVELYCTLKLNMLHRSRTRTCNALEILFTPLPDNLLCTFRHHDIDFTRLQWDWNMQLLPYWGEISNDKQCHACIITLKFIIVREGSLFLSRLRKTSIIVALKRRDFGHFKMNAIQFQILLNTIILRIEKS